MSVNPEFFIERQGKRVVLYAGLLQEAHAQGLKSIETELIQFPTEANGQVAICKAVVTMEGGRCFSGIGDANPQNVGRTIVPHLTRMAETRSKARALRDATNIAVTAFEELGDDEPTQSPRQARTEAQSASEEQSSGFAGQPEGQPERTPGGATKKAARYLEKLLIDAGHDEEKVKQLVPEMNAGVVSKKIEEYKGKEASG